MWGQVEGILNERLPLPDAELEVLRQETYIIGRFIIDRDFGKGEKRERKIGNRH